MNNELSTLIQQRLIQANDQAIWLIEENSQVLQLEQFAQTNCSAKKISNRFDLAKLYQAELSDFELKPLLTASPTKSKHIIFRIAKEKAINLHIIHSALHYLNHGSLSLYGFKNEGIKSLYKYLQQATANNPGTTLKQEKHGKQLFSLHLECQRDSITHNTDDKNTVDNYHEIQTLDLQGVAFLSKPGQFGWKKIDAGSQLLIQQLIKQIEKHPSTIDRKTLDLGCGYGFVSLSAHKLGVKHIDATDNCAAAIICCQENFKKYHIQGEVITDDCAANISTQYDCILCNPPFHHGFDHDKSLTEKFIEQAYKHLKQGGFALFVVNEFVGIEKEANKYFTKQQLLDKKSGFKVIKLNK